MKRSGFALLRHRPAAATTKAKGGPPAAAAKSEEAVAAAATTNSETTTTAGDTVESSAAQNDTQSKSQRDNRRPKRKLGEWGSVQLFVCFSLFNSHTILPDEATERAVALPPSLLTGETAAAAVDGQPPQPDQMVVEGAHEIQAMVPLEQRGDLCKLCGNGKMLFLPQHNNH